MTRPAQMPAVEVSPEPERRRDARAAAFPEIVALLRGLVARFPGADVPEARSARAWLGSHCPGCATPITEPARACRACRKTWRERVAAGQVAIP